MIRGAKKRNEESGKEREKEIHSSGICYYQVNSSNKGALPSTFILKNGNSNQEKIIKYILYIINSLEALSDLFSNLGYLLSCLHKNWQFYKL